MRNTFHKVTEQMSVLHESVWTKTLNIGDTFEVLKEVGSFYKIKSDALEEGTIACSILKTSLDNKSMPFSE